MLQIFFISLFIGPFCAKPFEILLNSDNHIPVNRTCSVFVIDVKI